MQFSHARSCHLFIEYWFLELPARWGQLAALGLLGSMSIEVAPFHQSENTPHQSYISRQILGEPPHWSNSSHTSRAKWGHANTTVAIWQLLKQSRTGEGIVCLPCWYQGADGVPGRRNDENWLCSLESGKFRVVLGPKYMCCGNHPWCSVEGDWAWVLWD